MLQNHLTRIVWPWEPELGVKDIFGGIPTLPSLSVSGNAQSPVYQCTCIYYTGNNNLLTKP